MTRADTAKLLVVQNADDKGEIVVAESHSMDASQSNLAFAWEVGLRRDPSAQPMEVHDRSVNVYVAPFHF